MGLSSALTPHHRVLLLCAGTWRVGCRGQEGDNGDCSPNNASLPTPPSPAGLSPAYIPSELSRVCSPSPLLAAHNGAGLWWGEVEAEPCAPEQLSSSTSLRSGMGTVQHHAPSLGLAPAQDTLLHLTGFAALPLHPYPKNQCSPVHCIPSPSTDASGTEQPISLPQ